MADIDYLQVNGSCLSQNFRATTNNKCEIGGVYELQKNENFYEQLIEYGIPEDKARLFNLANITLYVKDEGDVVTFINNLHPKAHVLKMEREVEEHLPLGIVIKSTATRNANTITIRSKFPNGKECTRIYDFHDNELISTIFLLDSPTIAKRIYKKVLNV